MAANSFIIKGWTVTLVFAFMALTSKDVSTFIRWLPLVPIVIFWALDGFYLATERRYRNLYDSIRSEKRGVRFVTFALDPKHNFWDWPSSLFSKTIFLFYGSLALVVVVLASTAPKEGAKMARRTFFSFHYERDIFRASIVRNSWVTKDRESAGFFDASLWEEAQKKGDAAVKKMIDDALVGTSVTVVLIGTETSSRPYVLYEIQESLKRGNGLLGIYINKIKSISGTTDVRGSNPLPSGYPTYDWVDNDGYSNMGLWIEEAAKRAGR